MSIKIANQEYWVHPLRRNAVREFIALTVFQGYTPWDAAEISGVELRPV
jgi:hypothetical protein